jgi:hypothetical protein
LCCGAECVCAIGHTVVNSPGHVQGPLGMRHQPTPKPVPAISPLPQKPLLCQSPHIPYRCSGVQGAVWLIDFGLSRASPPPSEAEKLEELDTLRSLFKLAASNCGLYASFPAGQHKLMPARSGCLHQPQSLANY